MIDSDLEEFDEVLYPSLISSFEEVKTIDWADFTSSFIENEEKVLPETQEEFIEFLNFSSCFFASNFFIVSFSGLTGFGIHLPSLTYIPSMNLYFLRISS